MEKCKICGGCLKAKFPSWSGGYSHKNKITLSALCSNCGKLHLCDMEFKNLDEYFNFQQCFNNNE